MKGGRGRQGAGGGDKARFLGEKGIQHLATITPQGEKGGGGLISQERS